MKQQTVGPDFNLASLSLQLRDKMNELCGVCNAPGKREIQTRKVDGVHCRLLILL